MNRRLAGWWARNSAWISVGVLIVAVASAYSNSLRGTFLYDDRDAILYNGSIRDLRNALVPPAGGLTVSGRPVLNISFALDYALHGLAPAGLHVSNGLIHLAATLVLLGIVRRTLVREGVEPRLRTQAGVIALTSAGWWGLHPVQTEAVTYLAQRAESLMSLFFLVTLYGFIRSVDATRRWAWYGLAALACALGMATKENMVCAPLIVLLYDRAFVSGSIAAALRRHRWIHLALASTWLVLGALLLRMHGARGASMGFGLGVSVIDQWGAQIVALSRYLALTFWPNPLVFDYGPILPLSWPAVILSLPLTLGVITLALYAIWRWPRTGLLAAVAVGVLATTSIVPSTTQMIVEHRMYLPLASVLVLAVTLAARLGRPAIAAVAIVALAGGLMTHARNRLYASEIAIWTDTVAKRPGNAIAHDSLGAALRDAGDRERAMLEFRIALSDHPNYSPALANLGYTLVEAGRPDAALPYVQRAVELEPDSAQAQLHFGLTLRRLGRLDEALPHLAEAARLMPLLPEAHNSYGDALVQNRRIDEGIEHLRTAVALNPRYAFAWFNLGAAYLRKGDMAAGEAAFARGLALRPDDLDARLAWAGLLAPAHPAEADAAYRRALATAPGSAEAELVYGNFLAKGRRLEEALRAFRAAVRLNPRNAAAHANVGNALLMLDRDHEAIPEFEAAIRGGAADARTHNSLGFALARTGRLREAVAEFEAALRLAPNYSNARANLERARAAVDAAGSSS